METNKMLNIKHIWIVYNAICFCFCCCFRTNLIEIFVLLEIGFHERDKSQQTPTEIAITHTSIFTQFVLQQMFLILEKSRGKRDKLQQKYICMEIIFPIEFEWLIVMSHHDLPFRSIAIPLPLHVCMLLIDKSPVYRQAFHE